MWADNGLRQMGFTFNYSQTIQLYDKTKIEFEIDGSADEISLGKIRDKMTELNLTPTPDNMKMALRELGVLSIKSQDALPQQTFEWNTIPADLVNQHLTEDNLRLSWRPLKNKVSNFAEFFTEWQFHLPTGESIEKNMGAIFSQNQFAEIMRGRAWVDVAAFNFLVAAAPFRITHKKLAALNLDIIKSGAPVANVVDLKVLYKLTNAALAAKAAARREKRRLYNLERRRAHRYYDEYGRERNDMPGLVEGRKRSHEKRSAAKRAAQEICPAYQYFLWLRRNKNKPVFVKKPKRFKDNKGKWRWAQVYVRYEKDNSQFFEVYKNANFNPIKIKMKCPALIAGDYKLCPLVQRAENLTIADKDKCELNHVFLFDGAAEKLKEFITNMSSSDLIRPSR